MTIAADPVGPILDASLAKQTESALQVMRMSLQDWTACALAGRSEPVARITRAMIVEEGGAEQASLLGGGRAPARAAALVNGATSHALDYDDTHFAHIGHPSVAVLSAALAMAERQGAGMRDMLKAALAGCEASIRFGLLFGRSHYQIGYHQTATAGAFGAGVAAAQLLGLGRDDLQAVIGLISTRASGLKSQFGTMGKPFNAGIAASNGVEAALLIAAGFQSNSDAMTGQNGFLTTHHADIEVSSSSRAEQAGFFMENVSHKFHACCHGLHATLEALQSLKPIDAQDVTAVSIATHPRWMTVCNIQTPRSGLEAKFSYRCVTALSLLGYDTGALTTFDDSLAQAPEVQAILPRVSVHADESLSEMQARVTVQTDQKSQEAFFDLDLPLDLDSRQSRIAAKTRALVGESTALQISQALDTDDLCALTALF